MAERKLNFDAPLLSARRMKKEAVSVRGNIAKKKLPDDDGSNKTSESLSVPLKCPLEKAMIDGDLTRQQVEEESEDGDDVFSDALDTLSLKHSISGGIVEETQPPMPSEEDPQCRDFMMNRFLPAAKSMQQPQYALKRRPMRQIRDIVAAENLATPKRYESITTPPSYYHGTDDDEESEEDDDDDDDDEDDEYLSKRGCGMMSPQVCFKNSIGMLLKEKPNSQVKSSSKVSQLKSRFQSVKKLALDSIYKQKPSVGNKFEQCESSLSMPSSPYRQTSCMSPYRSVGNSSPLHPSGFRGTRKEAEIMRANRLNKHIRKSQDLLYPKSITSQECSTSSVLEKTLYVVDTEKFSPEASNGQAANSETMETILEEPKPILELQESVEPALSTSGGIKKMEEEDGFEKNNSSGCDLSSPQLVPPPPKTPSDSWLFRTLHSRSYLFHPPKWNTEEHSTSVTKWETIVKKTSYVHRDHISYSQVSNLKT